MVSLTLGWFARVSIADALPPIARRQSAVD